MYLNFLLVAEPF
jgi:hypothetical protein